MNSRQVAFNVLAPGVQSIRGELDTAIARVLDSGWFLMGPELQAFEREFAAYHGTEQHAVGLGSGTDALRIGLLALGIQPGDEVLVTANAGVPPVAAVVAAGARPVFCDVDPHTHTLDPDEIDRRVTSHTTGMVVVHLYGHPADMPAIGERARRYGMKVLEDCAQAHGARLNGRLVGTWGDAGAFSFYPTKNLGALGDAGALLSADPSVAERARLLRMYGWKRKYVSELHSTVSRLDELQAAMLRVKLRHLDDWNAVRVDLAERYLEGLPEWLVGPPRGGVFHLFVVQARNRDALKAHLADSGVATDVHYPLPAHEQTPYAELARGPLPTTERLAREVLSLPMYPELSTENVDYVLKALRVYGA
ncbi:MAG: DegT/DnrJ/EryC1/StrS family aminotransferase [Chloroflexi bacterium]|nr:DegT/DnrJ/EryC1/StrS family aminotransferase [Chloroflexota bacterium]